MGFVMQVDVIDSENRGTTETDWLLSKHTYSFGRYHNLNRLNFGTLRVFNDDVVKPGKGFSTHRHENMEIITIVLSGALEHKDSAGNHGVIKPGDVQRMTAGSGIEHSEFNASKDEEVHFLQIWVYPEKRDLTPSYEQKNFSSELFHNKLIPIASRVSGENTLTVHQDATFYRGDFDAGQTLIHKPRSKSHGDYLFVIEGELKVGDTVLKTGDSAQITRADHIEGQALESSKVLLIEVNINTL